MPRRTDWLTIRATLYAGYKNSEQKISFCLVSQATSIFLEILDHRVGEKGVRLLVIPSKVLLQLDVYDAVGPTRRKRPVRDHDGCDVVQEVVETCE